MCQIYDKTSRQALFNWNLILVKASYAAAKFEKHHYGVFLLLRRAYYFLSAGRIIPPSTKINSAQQHSELLIRSICFSTSYEP